MPSYIAVVNEGQGDHHCYISGAADVIVVHKGPYGREGNHPQAWYGTAPRGTTNGASRNGVSTSAGAARRCIGTVVSGGHGVKYATYTLNY